MSIAVGMLLLTSLRIHAETVVCDTLSVTISFKVNRTEIQPNYMHNSAALDSIATAMRDSAYRDSHIHIIGYASPEGPYRNNERLSRRRAESLSQYLQTHYGISAGQITTDPIGVDWPGLVDTLKANPALPMADEVLHIINTTRDYDANGLWIGKRTHALKQLDNGRVWAYLLQHVYPYLRGANLLAIYQVVIPEPEPAPGPAPIVVEIEERQSAETFQSEELTDTVVAIPVVVEPKDRYWSLHTNLLYDAAIVPNVGAEFYLGKHFSLMANYWNAWWKRDSDHRYWRTYGLYLTGRYWIGKAAAAKPLTGHHIGIYAQALLYDFEWGGQGYLSGIPGENIFHKPTWSVGVEYGYALPIGKRLNLDFTLALGYLQGEYQKYIPADDEYLWQSTNKRRWIGPTKVELSLVWLLGHGNVNLKKKGG